MKLTAESKFKAVLGGCLLTGCLLGTSSVYSAFEPLPVGGRAAGMGEAYSAIADDAYALYYNPAGVLQINRPEIGTYYSRLYMGLTDNSDISRMFIGYAQPLGRAGKWGGIGASYLGLNLPNLYKEEAFGLTYGHEYKRLWNVGATLKILRKEIGSDEFTSNAIDPVTGNATGSADPLLAGGKSASTFGIDVGFQYRIHQAYAIGLAARNLNAPDLALGGDKDSAPAVLTAALARRIRNGSLDIEIMNWRSTESNLRLSVGGEKWFKSGFGLRAGGGFGSNDYSSVSLGASYKLDSFQIDYASVLPLQGIEGTYGLQQISLTVRLGKPPIDPLEQQLIKEKEKRIRAETEARYSKAERDRLRAERDNLKNKILELTQEKTKAERALENKRSQFTLRNAQDQSQQELNQQPLSEEQRQIFNNYTKALADYNTKVRSGVGLKVKRRLLERVLAEYKDKGVDTSTVVRELRSLKVEELRAKKDYDLSMSFYTKLVQQGASPDERSTMLKRILQKYKNTGVNIKSALDELKRLK